ncbi:alpha-L-fucosidase, partial [Candidatus Sumerlaeota bacterium]|nr:alpha-L-fucosidase [Candidatus Sumerlaeota bacterium]
MRLSRVVIASIAFVALAVCLNCRLVRRPEPSLQAKPGQMQWWRDAKFGLFIHWGPVSLKGTEIGWSRGGERRGRKDKSTGPIPVEEYDNLYKKFNPIKFNADEWVAIAKAAGMNYMVFTSKHHDGFSMFDSKMTTYTIMRSPFGRDVVGELARACHKAGLKVGWYYSPPDWYHPDYRTDRHARYIEFLHGQLRELCTNYGKIDIIWFDGLGGKPDDWDTTRLITMIRKLQPAVIINNRAGVPADHDTPEQRIGRFQTDRAWESCITIGTQWAWKPDDKIKSLKQCIDTLVRVVGGDGNLLFNVGPMPTGEIEPRQVERLKEMGAWLRKYGETIYGARGGPFEPGPWGAATYRGNTIYVHILDWKLEGDVVVLPP